MEILTQEPKITGQETEGQKLQILKQKVNQYINSKSVDIGQAFQSIENDNNHLNDFIVPNSSLNFYNDNGTVFMAGSGMDPVRFNDHSIVQTAVKYNVPSAYLKNLHKGNTWEKNLAVNILNEHAKYATRQRLLVREVNGVARGVLSDSYKRLSTFIIFTTFLQEVKNHNMVLLDSFNSPTRTYLEAINPNIVSIPTGKNGVVHMVYGLQLRNSEFGNGALELRGYEMQCVCLNGMVTKSAIREVHLGKKLPSDITLSDKTYMHDSQTKASLVKDYIQHFFSDDARRMKKQRIQIAAGTPVDMEKEITRLPRLGATEDEAKRVREVIMRNRPSDGVQGESTLFKFAQAVGAVARDSQSPERKREVEEIAGQVMERTGR